MKSEDLFAFLGRSWFSDPRLSTLPYVGETGLAICLYVQLGPRDRGDPVARRDIPLGCILCILCPCDARWGLVL